MRMMKLIILNVLVGAYIHVLWLQELIASLPVFLEVDWLLSQLLLGLRAYVARLCGKSD